MSSLPLLLCLCQTILTVETGSHSQWIFATVIIGDTPFPEFSVVVMLDDIQMGSYDSHTQTMMYSQHRSDENRDKKVEGNLLDVLHIQMKDAAHHLKHQLNSTEEILVKQHLLGCEILDDDSQGPHHYRYAFNGVDGTWLYNKSLDTVEYEGVLADLWSSVVKTARKCIYANYFVPACMSSLKSDLKSAKKVVMRKVKPRVRLLQKRLPDSGEVRVTCLATGFYPRHINLTLLRDGQPEPDHQVTGGELLPNGDETYQMRKSLEVSTEELQQHHYTCTAQHLSLDNKLDFGLEYEPEGPSVVMVSFALVSLVLVVTGITTGFILWRKRNRCTQTSSISTSYSVASSSVDENTTTEHAL